MKISRHAAPSRRPGRRRPGAWAAVTLAAALAIARTPAMAEVKVSGNPDVVTIDAQNSSIGEILAALGREFKVQYRSSADLNRQVTGTYQGSVRQVVTRILDGYNFVVQSGPGGIDVTVLGTTNAQTNNGAPPVVFRGPFPQPVPRGPAGTAPMPRPGLLPAQVRQMQLSNAVSAAPPLLRPAAGDSLAVPPPLGR